MGWAKELQRQTLQKHTRKGIYFIPKVDPMFGKLYSPSDEHLDISSAFLDGDLLVPEIHPAALRVKLVRELHDQLDEHAILWLSARPPQVRRHRPLFFPNPGQRGVLWIDCRDVSPGQLVEHQPGGRWLIKPRGTDRWKRYSWSSAILSMSPRRYWRKKSLIELMPNNRNG